MLLLDVVPEVGHRLGEAGRGCVGGGLEVHDGGAEAPVRAALAAQPGGLVIPPERLLGLAGLEQCSRGRVLPDRIAHGQCEHHVGLADGFNASQFHLCSLLLAGLGVPRTADAIALQQLVRFKHGAVNQRAELHGCRGLQPLAIRIDEPFPVVIRAGSYTVQVAGTHRRIGVVFGVGGHLLASHSPHQSLSIGCGHDPPQSLAGA